MANRAEAGPIEAGSVVVATTSVTILHDVVLMENELK
jgi:hypothetical protein